MENELLSDYYRSMVAVECRLVISAMDSRATFRQLSIFCSNVPKVRHVDMHIAPSQCM